MTPIAVNDAGPSAEDDPATAIDVLANDTDPDGGAIMISSITQPTTRPVSWSRAAARGLTYKPNANYCNNPPGTNQDTFTYTVNGNSANKTATVSMAVNCVDDPPIAVDDSFTVSENSGANALAVVANDDDIDGGPKTIDSVTQPTNGTVAAHGQLDRSPTHRTRITAARRGPPTTSPTRWPVARPRRSTSPSTAS